MNRNLKIAALAALGGFVALELFFLQSSGGTIEEKPAEPDRIIMEMGGREALNPVKDRKVWSDMIDREGGAAAYAYMLKSYETQHYGIQHNAAHIMGELLYEKLGIDGFQVCDASYSFGCYHSFIGRAFADRGVGIIGELNKGCVERFGPYGTGCQHGVGHGLLEYMGRDRLVDALDACKQTTQRKPIFGCTSGVFMENNVPIAIDGERAELAVRKPDPNDIYAPCSTIPEEYRASCYYEMAQWWDKIYRNDFRKLGELCDKMPDQKYREECFLGIGNMTAPTSDYEVAGAIAKCDLMPDRAALLNCRAGSSWSFFAYPPSRESAPQMCSDLPTAERERCAKASDLIGTGEILPPS